MLPGYGRFGGGGGVTGGGGPSSLFSGGQGGGWFDFSDLSTMFQDTAGTTPVTTAGQLIARINDKSGNGRHLTQATEAKRPAYQTSGGLHWADFDGGDYLESASFTSMSQPNVVALAAKFDNVTGGQQLFDGLGTLPLGDGDRHAIYLKNATSEGLYFFSGTEVNARRQMTTSPFVVNVEYNDASSKYRFNGSVLLSGFNPGPRTLGGYRLGAFVDGNSHLDGRIYGVLVRDTLFSTEEIGIAESWLAGLSGVTGLGSGYSVKLVCTSGNEANGDVLFQEVEMRESYGGADVTGSGAAGGTPGWYSLAEGPANAFNNSTADWWQSRITGGSCELIYHFGPSYSGGGITELFITAHPSFTDRTPSAIEVFESTNGGESWSSAATFSGLTPFGNTRTLQW